MDKSYKISLFKKMQAQLNVGQGSILKNAIENLEAHKIQEIYPLLKTMNKNTKHTFWNVLVEVFAELEPRPNPYFFRQDKDSCNLLCNLLKEINLYKNLEMFGYEKAKSVYMLLKLFPDAKSNYIDEILPIYQTMMSLIIEKSLNYYENLEDSGELRIHADSLGLVGNQIFNMEEVTFRSLERYCKEEGVAYLDNNKNIMDNFRNWCNICQISAKIHEEKNALLSVVQESGVKVSKKQKIL